MTPPMTAAVVAADAPLDPGVPAAADPPLADPDPDVVAEPEDDVTVTEEVSPDEVWEMMAVVSTADKEVMLYACRKDGVKTDAMFDVKEAAAELAAAALVPRGSVTATLAMTEPGWKEKTYAETFLNPRVLCM